MSRILAASDFFLAFAQGLTCSPHFCMLSPAHPAPLTIEKYRCIRGVQYRCISLGDVGQGIISCMVGRLNPPTIVQGLWKGRGDKGRVRL